MFIGSSIPPNAKPLRNEPWLTQDAIAFLTEFFAHHTHPHILEFGSGSSTVWFAHRTKHLVSVEHRPDWYAIVTQLLSQTKKAYPVYRILHTIPYDIVCNNFPNIHFDLILIDGANRNGCMQKAMRIIKPNGILMIDNAERPWYEKSYRLLSNWSMHITYQKKPDSYGFYDPTWQTRWFIKPSL